MSLDRISSQRLAVACALEVQTASKHLVEASQSSYGVELLNESQVITMLQAVGDLQSALTELLKIIPLQKERAA